jgi:purine-binding chemotaxis protein CheW
MDAAARGVSQALVFLLGGGQFAVDIPQVQEIRGSDRPTPIPSAPVFFRGVTNLRGRFVPVIDLRIKLGIDVVDSAPGGVTIILMIRGQHVGVVVDGVSEVIDIAMDDLKPAPFGHYAASAMFIRGFLQSGDRTIVMLEVERLLEGGGVDLAALTSSAQVSAS